MSAEKCLHGVKTRRIHERNNKTNNNLYYYFLVRDDEMELSREEEPKSIASSAVNGRGDVCSIKPTESSLNIISSVRY